MVDYDPNSVLNIISYTPSDANYKKFEHALSFFNLLRNSTKYRFARVLYD